MLEMLQIEKRKEEKKKKEKEFLVSPNNAVSLTRRPDIRQRGEKKERRKKY